MSSFVLKIIAMISMFFDHFGYGLVGHFSSFNYIGRLAFPIFAFQISEGYLHTKNLKKYFLRLFIFAIISQIPFSLFMQKFISTSSLSLNVFFTLLLGLFSITVYDYFSKVKNKELNYQIFGVSVKHIVGILFVLLIAYIGELLHVDYGFWGIFVIFIFHLFKSHTPAMMIAYIALCVIRYGLRILCDGFLIEYVYLALATIFPIIFIWLYNGKQGRKIKYGLYLFYPIHLLLLYFFM